MRRSFIEKVKQQQERQKQDTGLLSQIEACELLNCSREYLMSILATGEVVYRKHRNRYWINRESLLEFFNRAG